MLKYLQIQSVLFLLIVASPAFAQQSYFPPVNSDNWEILSPEELGWCETEIEQLYELLEERNTKGFIVLKEGKIVIEKYFGSFTQDSIWYWASTGKSLAGFLTGMAQEQGYVDINDPTSDYLGTGWTSLTLEQEEKITLRHQLSMTTGLNDGLPPTASNPNPTDCTAPVCLQYLAAPGSRWAYHNAAYRLLQDVIAEATNQTFNAFTKQQLGDRIGMKGAWINYVRYGRARDLARFGLLVLNKGIWGTDTLLADQQYFYDMLHPSQDLNPAYGYLWWLPGQDRYMLPSLQAVFPGDLIPNAPADAYAALGKNDQKIYVVPSQDLVVIRIGNKANQSLFALTEFDNELWGSINKLSCQTTATSDHWTAAQIQIGPNPSMDHLQVSGLPAHTTLRLYNILGRQLWSGQSDGWGSQQVDLTPFPRGTYLLQMESQGKLITRKIVKGVNRA